MKIPPIRDNTNAIVGFSCVLIVNVILHLFLSLLLQLNL
jgi:hypothetical protein